MWEYLNTSQQKESPISREKKRRIGLTGPETRSRNGIERRRPLMYEDRILLVTATLGRWGETNGVVNTYLNLISQFRKRNMAVDVITYGPEDGKQTDGSVTITTRRPRLPVKVDEDLVLDSDLSMLGLSRELAKNDYDIVHSATPDLLGWLAVLTARSCDCPLVLQPVT